MNISDFTYLINKPDAINERHNLSLEKIIEEFPYFQSARVLRLKHLYNQDSFKYNYALKVAAAYTTDRAILFDFITSDKFITVQNGLYEQKIAELLNIEVHDSETIVPKSTPNFNKTEQSILDTIEKASKITFEQKLDLGKPLEFNQNETHSFQEWLQLARFKPIIREENKQTNNPDKLKKLELIDKFIEANPKIPPINKTTPLPTKDPINEDKTHLMTETLAKVYLEQKKYDRAIQAYEILILKYPEKSSLFAVRIEDIKNLQQNNNFKQ
jgi:hypothetical protein